MNMRYYLIRVTRWPGTGHFRNRLNLKEPFPGLEIFTDRNQIFKEKRNYLNAKLFSGKKKNQLQSQSLIYGT